MPNVITLDDLWRQYDKATLPETKRLLRVAIEATVRIAQLKETTQELDTFHKERNR